MTAGTEYRRRAYAMIDALPPEELRALHFGKMVSGTVRNIVSGQTVLEGSLRTYREETYLHCREQLEMIGRAIAQETGCNVDVLVSDGYPAVWNPEEFYAEICEQVGEDAPAHQATPSLAGEDFSFYQRAVPGIFFFLGVGNTAELHAQNFAFDDEAVLPCGVEFLKKLMMLP
jgi:hippurate hydrolase